MITKKHLAIVSLALALPSTIIVVSIGIWSLIEKGYLHEYVGVGIILAVIINTFYLIIKYAKKNS
jgi:hypothetical protein